MNEAGEIYLTHYSGIDAADHMIKNAGIRYITWKYWHVPYLHALSLGVIAAHDMYRELCIGTCTSVFKKKNVSNSKIITVSNGSCLKIQKNGFYIGNFYGNAPAGCHRIMFETVLRTPFQALTKGWLVKTRINVGISMMVSK